MDSRAQSLIMGNPKDSANYDIKYSNESSFVAKEVLNSKIFIKTYKR